MRTFKLSASRCVFFHSISTKEIIEELSAQTNIDAKSYNTVIFCLSERDIFDKINTDAILSQLTRLKQFFINTSFYVTDYIITPNLICCGMWDQVKKMNLCPLSFATGPDIVGKGFLV